MNADALVATIARLAGNQWRRLLLPQNRSAIATLLMVSLAVSAGCSKTATDTKQELQAELNSNPKLKQRGIVVRVVTFENGYVIADIGAGHSREAAKALYEGKTLNEIYFLTDTAVAPLLEAEEILKKKPGIKAVMWTAKSLKQRARKR